MAATDQHIRVEDGIKCADGVLRYRINVNNERVVVRRFNDFKACDMGLGKGVQKPTLPSSGLLGFRKNLGIFEFNETRRAGLETYLNELCAGSARQWVLDTFLTDTVVELHEKKAAELEPYTTAELKAFGFNGLQLLAKGRTAELLEERCKDRTLNQFDYYSTSSRSEEQTVAREEIKNAGFDNVVEEFSNAGNGLEDHLVLGKELPVEAAIRAFGKARVIESHQYSAYDLKQCGFKVQDLKEHQYKDVDIWQAGFSMPELRQAGISLQALHPKQDISHPSSAPVEPKTARSTRLQFLTENCGCLPCGGLQKMFGK